MVRNGSQQEWEVITEAGAVPVLPLSMAIDRFPCMQAPALLKTYAHMGVRGHSEPDVVCFNRDESREGRCHVAQP